MSANDQQIQLFHAARRGDTASLGLLLEQHRVHLYATALRFYGVAAAAEDVVADTMLTALTKFNQVKAPEAFGGWLQATLRNVCLMQLRERRRVATLPDEDLDHSPSEQLSYSLEARIEQSLQRDWVWNALSGLSEPLRATVMLKYYGRHTSYEAIAEILAIPVGTVRSRLSQARGLLADALRKSAETVRSDALELTAYRRSHFETVWQHLNERGDVRSFVDDYEDDLLLYYSRKRPPLRGRRFWEEDVLKDYRDGIRIKQERVLASGSVTIFEANFQNPPHAPYHCPPSGTLVMFHDKRSDRVHRLHLYNSPRLPEDPLNRPPIKRQNMVFLQAG